MIAADERNLPALVALAGATAIASLGLGAGGTAGALLGTELTGSEAAAGLPLGVLVMGSAVAALAIGRRSAQAGRGQGLMLGYALGAIGAAIVILSAELESIVALLIGSLLLGSANASIFLTRYAGADLGGPAARGRTIGTILFATAAGAITSPLLLSPTGELAELLGLPRLAGLYLVAVGAFVVAGSLLAALSTPAVPSLRREPGALGPREERPLSRDRLAGGLRAPNARAAIAILTVTNLVMVGVMAIAPVHLGAHGHNLGLIGGVIAVHVAAMFLPSPLSGWLSDQFGPVPVAAAGIALLGAAGIAGAAAPGDDVLAATGALALLGLGWNLGVVGGSSLLAASVAPPLRPQVEGIGEVAMGLAAAVGAPTAGVVAATGGYAALSLAGACAAGLGLVAARRTLGSGALRA